MCNYHTLKSHHIPQNSVSQHFELPICTYLYSNVKLLSSDMFFSTELCCVQLFCPWACWTKFCVCLMGGRMAFLFRMPTICSLSLSESGCTWCNKMIKTKLTQNINSLFYIILMLINAPALINAPWNGVISSREGLHLQKQILSCKGWPFREGRQRKEKL